MTWDNITMNSRTSTPLAKVFLNDLCFHYIFTQESDFTNGRTIEERQIPFEKYLGRQHTYGAGLYGIKHQDDKVFEHSESQLFVKPDTIFSYVSQHTTKWTVVEIKSSAINERDVSSSIQEKHKDFLQAVISAWVCRPLLKPRKVGVLVVVRFRNAFFFTDDIAPFINTLEFYYSFLKLYRSLKNERHDSFSATDLAKVIATLEPSIHTPQLTEEELRDKGNLFELINTYGKDISKLRNAMQNRTPSKMC